MTFSGAVVGCTPSAEGARGRARCRNDSVPTAMLGRYFIESKNQEEEEVVISA